MDVLIEAATALENLDILATVAIGGGNPNVVDLPPTGPKEDL